MTARDRRIESGAATLELVISASLVLTFIMFVIGLGRLALASQVVDAAAYDAARAASLTRSPGAAGPAGQSAATKSLGNRGMSCASLSVRVDVSDYRAGGQVRVRVTCTARLSDVALSGLPGRKTYQANAVVPIEQFRAE